MKKNFIIMLVLMGIIMMVFTFILTKEVINNNNNQQIEQIKKELKINRIELTENGYLIQIDIDNDLNYYFYED